jgi:membrane associated rhomboid family serine protease
VIIPLRDLNRPRSTPVVTYLLIAANLVVFGYQLTLGQVGLELFVRQHGLVPAYLMTGHPGSIGTLFSSMFIHGGVAHVALNMWSLWIFGDNVEDAFGKLRFVLFYVLCGLGAAAAQVLIEPGSGVPMVGASGAIAGVMAAYLKLFPRARIVMALWVLLVFTFTLPAWFFIVMWFGLQLLLGLNVLHEGATASGGVAVFAHIGGFLAGLWLSQGTARRRNATAGFRVPSRHGYH